MTRLSRALSILRWGTADLSATAGVSERTVRRWLNGRMEIPRPVLEWLEGLARVHEAMPPPRKPQDGLTLPAVAHSDAAPPTAVATPGPAPGGCIVPASIGARCFR